MFRAIYENSVVRVVMFIMLFLFAAAILDGGAGGYEGLCGDGGRYDADC